MFNPGLLFFSDPESASNQSGGNPRNFSPENGAGIDPSSNPGHLEIQQKFLDPGVSERDLSFRDQNPGNFYPGDPNDADSSLGFQPFVHWNEARLIQGQDRQRRKKKVIRFEVSQ